MSDTSPGGQEILLIAGPTASGKSALALTWARERGAVVINADSMQVYRDLRVITARPTPEEEAAARHALYGHVDGAQNYSVGRYAADAAALLAALDQEERPAVFVGGTGLYFKALTEGLSSLPPVPDEVRDAIRRDCEGVTTPELHARLASADPETASTLRPSDRLRVMRALEVHAATGEPLARLRRERVPGPLAGRRLRKLFLAPEREVLRGRIDQRFCEMIAGGALDEVRALASRGLDPMLPIMRAHGVPALIEHLAGGIPLDEAIATGQGDTRRYAKRQFTWFRHQLADWCWVSPEQARMLLI